MGELENDMDALFQEAAAHYPLKTDNADWDKLIGKLNAATPLHIRHKAARNKKKILWFILLFPMGWLYGPYSYIHRNNAVAAYATVIDTTIGNRIAKLNVDRSQNYFQSKVFGAAQSKNRSIQRRARHLNNIVSTPVTYLDSIVSTDVLAYHGKIATDNNTENSIGHTGNLTNTQLGFNDNGSAGYNLERAITQPNKDIGQLESSTGLNVAIEKTDGKVIDMTDTTEKFLTLDRKAAGKKNSFYLSLMAGIDASSVKGQSIKKVGYSAGILVGYNLSKRFGIEIGFSWNDKLYYTNGAYFDKGRTDMPNSTILLGMNGQSTMIEVPICLKYNFLQRKKGLFFATAGISSYFMKSEGYNYESITNGQQKWGTVMYENTGNGFSVAGLSIGYQKKLGKFGSLRISPYLKLPFKGLGIGNLPITSSGINIGITHNLP